MAEGVYNVYKLGLAKADEDWDEGVGDYRARLLTGATTFDATDATFGAVIASGNTEASDGSYTAQALANQVAALDGNVAELTADTIDFGALNNETPTAMVIVRNVDGGNADIPVSFHDTNFGAAANGAGYTVTIGASGLITIS